MSESPKYPNEFDDLDFEVIEEHWNEYELDDGSRVRGRLILRKIITDPHDLEYCGLDLAPPIFTVHTPISHRGQKNNAPRPDEYYKLPKYEVRIKRADEKYNRYRILRNGRIVKIKLEVPEINRLTDKFDNEGLPFYLMSHGQSILINDSKNTIQP